MFTGIVQGVATVRALTEKPGLSTFLLQLPAGFSQAEQAKAGLEPLAIGASVACDGVCLTVTELPAPDCAVFDVMQQTLQLTTLNSLSVGAQLNVERAAREGAEIGGHPLSGHVDFTAKVIAIRQPDNNYVLRLAIPEPYQRYLFAKGYIAVNGASLTMAEVNRTEGWFEVWLIPETLRMTTFAQKTLGSALNIEIERSTQVFVDTVRATIDERLGPLLPALEAMLKKQGSSLDELSQGSASWQSMPKP